MAESQGTGDGTLQRQGSTGLGPWIERSEPVTLSLAAFSIALYLGEIRGFWVEMGLESLRLPVTLAIDALFAVDLLAKIAVLRGAYLRSPWFAIDLVSTLPILSTLAALPGAIAGLRSVRALRVFRVLRSLRTLRALRLLRTVSAMRREMPSDRQTEEGRAFDRALTLGVIAFSASFLAILEITDHAPVAEFALVIGSLLGMALVLVVVHFQVRDLSVRQVRELLNVALPRQVAEHFLRHPDSYHDTVCMPGTVVFCDLVGFTRTVEELQGDLGALKRHLERAMDAVVDVHVEWDLIVDKFIGDAVLSFRGGNLVEGSPEEHAWRTVRASLDSVKALERLADPCFRSIKVGGASAGALLIGTFGTSKRLSYTVLGARVNLASRLELACGKFGASNLFCERTRELTQDRADLRWRRICKIHVQGVAEPVDVHEALDAGAAGPWIDRYAEGLALFEAGRFTEAREAFAAVIAARPQGDGPSRVVLSECDRWLACGTPEGWLPVIEVSK